MEKRRKKQIGKLLTKLLMKMIFSKIFLIILLIVIIVTIVGSVIKYIIDLDITVYDDSKKGNVSYEVSEYIKCAKVDENGIYFEVQDSEGNVKRATVEDLWKSIENEGTELRQYLDSYEEFEKLIYAEVVTQFPYMGVGNGKLDGTIKFQRHYSNNDVKYLSYINSETFDNYLNSSDENVLDYFTLDSDGNAIIAVKNELEEYLTTDDPLCSPSTYSQNFGEPDSSGSYSYEKVTIKKQDPINYKMYVQQYTMPFQFLWPLLVIGQDKDFVMELVDLVSNSEIVISLYDNETKIDTSDVYTRKDIIKVKKEEDSSETTTDDEEDDEEDDEDEYEEKEVTYTTTYKSTSITDTPEIALTKANVWIADYEQEYEYQDTTNENSEEDSQIDDNTTLSSNVIIESKKYISKPASVKSKDDKNASDPNFVNILSKPKYKYTRDNITGSTGELFEIFEKNPDTANGMVVLLKYLLYKVTGKSYGVKEYDFSAYNSVSFETASDSASDLLVQYIHSWEHTSAPPTSADGTKYIIEEDGYGNLVVGYGVDIYNCGYTDLFKQAGFSLTKGAEIDKDFVDSIEKMIIESKTEEMKKALSGLSLTEYQMNAMICRAYNAGTAGATKSRGGKTFVQAYTEYWDQSRDDKYSKKDPNADFSHKLYSTYMYLPNTAKSQFSSGLEKRRKSEWTLFQTGYYDTLKKWHSEGEGSIIDTAAKIHSYMEQNNYTYCVHGTNSYEECKSGEPHGLNTTFEASKNGYHHTCCASYVSWVLQEAGYLSDSEHSDSASGLQTIMKNKGFEVISNKADLKPGDVLCYSGHVEIYAGDNKIYNAGSGKAIRNAAPSNLTRSFSYALRPVKK